MMKKLGEDSTSSNGEKKKKCRQTWIPLNLKVHKKQCLANETQECNPSATLEQDFFFKEYEQRHIYRNPTQRKPTI